MSRFLSLAHSLAKLMDIFAGFALVGIMLLTSLDVILRYFGNPIPGTYDIVSLTAAFVIGFALPRTAWDKTHVTVDILVDRFPGTKAPFHVITRILALLFFILLAWNLIKLGLSFAKTGESTLTLALPLYFVAFALGICTVAQCIVLMADLVRPINQEGDHE
jgi:TRAP-type C4-dicarboxylate transport system permease small subunit